jgi:uncharacterized protein YPO0396
MSETKEEQLQLAVEKGNKSFTHKLRSIVLVNWYLFDSHEIRIKNDSILFRGRNGAGKSSVLDAIQAIMAGGDENLISLNASGNDGKRSGRTLYSYAIGEVAESPGELGIKPRAITNTYICLNFEDRNNKPYCFGLAMHAKSSSKQSLKKHHFIMKGQELHPEDFKSDDYTVMPWQDVEKRLVSYEGNVSFPTNSSEFRDGMCQLLSATGADQYISPRQMFRALKNGLTFSAQKDINEFTRNYILAPSPIDVLAIERDYKDYKDIKRTITDTREKLEVIKGIDTDITAHTKELAKIVGYEWCEQEAKVSALDAHIEMLNDKLEKARISFKSNTKKLEQGEKVKSSVQQARDQAFSNWNTSDVQTSIKKFTDQQERLTTEVGVIENGFNAMRSSLAAIENLVCPATMTEQLITEFNSAHTALAKATGIEEGLASTPWPRSVDNIQETADALALFHNLVGELKGIQAEYFTNYQLHKNNFDEIKKAVENAKAGKASLRESTTKMVQLLSEHGITAVPVCDLAEITDETWQSGIERFLGSNREALVIVHEDAAQMRSNFDWALKIYRKEKDRDTSLRSVKLVVHGSYVESETGKHSKEAFAASLIKTDNDTVKSFLHKSLHNVKLVETDEELKREKRAITKDGMVKGNQVISGGNEIKSILFGVKARKQQAKLLLEELDSILPRLTEAEQDYRLISSIVSVLNVDLTRVAVDINDAASQLADLDSKRGSIRELGKQLAELESSDETALEQIFNDADKALEIIFKQIHSAKISISSAKKDIVEILGSDESGDGVLRQAEVDIDAAGRLRHAIGQKHGFDQVIANELLERLCEKFNDEFKLIELESKSSYKSKEEKVRDKENRIKGKVFKYCSEYEPDDRKELVELGLAELQNRIQGQITTIYTIDIIRYEDDAAMATDRMVKSFRAEIIALLKGNFQRIEDTFKILNGSLKALPFNNSIYRFKHTLTGNESLRAVYEYATDNSDLKKEDVGGLFDDEGDHPAVPIIENILKEGNLDDIADYRNFFSYNIISKDQTTGTEKDFNELLKSGSGGEKQSPFYVALGASFLSCFKLRKAGNVMTGGAAFCLFDEAFGHLDGQNTRAALRFFKSIGLQVILAAPPEIDFKVGPYVDESVTLIKAGDQMMLDHGEYTQAGMDLLESDDPDAHPEIIDEIQKRLEDESSN